MSYGHLLYVGERWLMQLENLTVSVRFRNIWQIIQSDGSHLSWVLTLTVVQSLYQSQFGLRTALTTWTHCLVIHVQVCKEIFIEAGSHSFDNTKFTSEFVWYIFVHLSHSGLIIVVITYCQTSNISWTLVGITIVDHSDVIGASAVGVCSNYIIILDFNTWFQYIAQIQLHDRMKKN